MSIEEGGIFLLIVMAVLFFGGIASISYQQEIFTSFVFMGLVILLIFNKEKRFITSLLLAFLIGFTDFYGF